MNISIIAASPRRNSVTDRLAVYLFNHFKSTTSHTYNYIDVKDWPLNALEHETIKSVEKAPEAVKPLAEMMFISDAFIVITPEYNGSYTAALKNLFDHFPKQLHKAFGIVTASTGAFGGMRAAIQMQTFIIALFGIASPYMLITPQVDKKFDASGTLLDLSFKSQVDTFTAEFLWLAESISPVTTHYH